MSTIPLAHYANAETKALSMKQEEDVRARITGYDERLADLDAMGIDMQLVMPPPNQCFYTVQLDVSVRASRMVNDVCGAQARALCRARHRTADER